MPRTAKDVRKLVEDAGIKILDLRFVDLPGVWQHFSLPAKDISDDLFGEGVGSPEAQKQISAGLKHGLQTRDAELDLGRVLGDLTRVDRLGSSGARWVPKSPWFPGKRRGIGVGAGLQGFS